MAAAAATAVVIGAIVASRGAPPAEVRVERGSSPAPVVARWAEPARSPESPVAPDPQESDPASKPLLQPSRERAVRVSDLSLDRPRETRPWEGEGEASEPTILADPALELDEYYDPEWFPEEQ